MKESGKNERADRRRGENAGSVKISRQFKCQKSMSKVKGISEPVDLTFTLKPSKLDCADKPADAVKNKIIIDREIFAH